MITANPNTNIKYIIGSKVFLYILAHRIFTKTNNQISANEIPIFTVGSSKSKAASVNPRPITTSRMNETQIYAMTPITIDKPNHWEKLAMNPK